MFESLKDGMKWQAEMFSMSFGVSDKKALCIYASQCVMGWGGIATMIFISFPLGLAMAVPPAAIGLLAVHQLGKKQTATTNL